MVAARGWSGAPCPSFSLVRCHTTSSSKLHSLRQRVSSPFNSLIPPSFAAMLHMEEGRSVKNESVVERPTSTCLLDEFGGFELTSVLSHHTVDCLLFNHDRVVANVVSRPRTRAFFSASQLLGMISLILRIYDDTARAAPSIAFVVKRIFSQPPSCCC